MSVEVRWTAILLWITTAFFAVVLSKTRKRIIVGEEDFYLTRQALNNEFWLSYKGCLASDTIVHTGQQKIMFRQVTDGSNLYQGVYDNSGVLRDCEVKKRRHDIESYVREFEKDVRQKRKISRAKFNVSESYMTLDPKKTDEGFLKYIETLVNFDKLTRECRRLHDSLNDEIVRKRTHRSRNKRSLIFPGTKWCGSGNSAKHENDLGTDINTDRCCREHDRCPYYILGFETKWHLFNSWFGTVSHCDCDNSFKTCLRSARTGTANMVGKVFFNFIKRSCFVLRKRKACVQKSWWGICLKRKRTLVGKFKKIKKYRPL